MTEHNKLLKQLTSLTPGGSEFHNSPGNCIEWIKERLESQYKRIVVLTCRNKLLEERIKELEQELNTKE